MKLLIKPLATIIALASGSLSYAEGSIEGRLIDVLGKTSYTDAVVRIEELQRETLTGASGRFRLPLVPAGEYTLTVIVGGELVKQHTVSVTDDTTSTEKILLNDEADELEEVLVIGQAAQMQRALDRQRFADNIVSAINADAIGELPDNNAAEALQRVPGLSIERDQGEGRFVRVRGISPDLNAVTVNGTQLPAPEGGRRAVALDVMPADLISSLVVTKTLTPDMDANAIGGAIEVKSLSALDRDGVFASVRAEASYDEHTDQTSPAYAVTAGNTFDLSAGKRLGVAAALSWEKRKFGSDNVETGGKWKFDDGAVEGLEELQLRDYTLERSRIGAALNFDLELDASNSLYLRTLYSEYKDDEQRQKAEVTFGKLDDNNEFEDAERLPGVTGLGEVKRELKDREETQKILSTTLGGEHFIDNWTLEYAAGFSTAEEDEPGGISGAEFKTKEDTLNGLGYRNTREPRMIAGNDFFDASQYELDKIETEKALTKDEQTSFQFDVTRDFYINDNPALVKFGVKSSARKKTVDEDVAEYEDFAEKEMTAYINGNVDYNNGRFGPEISPSKVRSALSGVDSEDDKEGKSIIADNEIKEDINAAYLMGRVDIDNWRILAGVRHEATQTDLKGSKVNFYEDDNGDDQLNITPVNVDKNYSHTLPALHVRYQLGDATQIRAAWTNAIVRPTFEQMSPSFSQEGIDDPEAEKGNPDLQAMESANFDLGIEHFTGTAGVLSAFLFRKDIENFIFKTDLSGTPQYSNFKKVETWRNGDNGKITGIELAYSQKMSMLPAPFDGLLVSMNATVSDSQASIATFDEGEKFSRDIPLPSQSDVTGNLVIGYEKNDWMFRLAANYKSEYLLEVQDAKEKTEDIYQAAQTQLDLSTSYAINEQLKVNFDIANITDEPYYSYQYKEKYNAQHEDYGPTYRLGISYKTF